MKVEREGNLFAIGAGYRKGQHTDSVVAPSGNGSLSLGENDSGAIELRQSRPVRLRAMNRW